MGSGNGFPGGWASTFAAMSDMSNTSALERANQRESQRRAEIALRESERRFRSVFESATDAIVLADQNGIISSWNRSAQAIFGYTEGELLGKPLTVLMPPRYRGRHGEGLSRYRNGAGEGPVIGRTLELHGLRKDGTEFPIELSVAVWQTAAGPHFSGIIRDITQRKRAEEELRKTLEREKELSQLKSNFVSMVSHEFRTPLGIIQSSAELLRDFHGKMSPGERDEQLQSIARNTRRMAGMMEEVLVLSRLDAGKLNFQPAPLDLNLFCRRVVDEVLSATS